MPAEQSLLVQSRAVSQQKRYRNKPPSSSLIFRASSSRVCTRNDRRRPRRMSISPAQSYRPFRTSIRLSHKFILRSRCSTVKLSPRVEGQTGFEPVPSDCRLETFDLMFGGECSAWSENLNLFAHPPCLYRLGYLAALGEGRTRTCTGWGDPLKLSFSLSLHSAAQSSGGVTKVQFAKWLNSKTPLESRGVLASRLGLAE